MRMIHVYALYVQESAEGLPPLPPGGRRVTLNPGALGPYGAFGAGMGAGSYMGLGMPVSASDQLREASDRLRKLQATAAGPPPLKDVITVGEDGLGWAMSSPG